ncbi:MAG: universal stress protein [Ferruginibacter sp.]
MKTILVPTDFSNAASNAANYAAHMALALNADILLLHIYQTPVVYLEVPLAVSESHIFPDIEKQIIKLKEELTRKTGGKITIETEIRAGIFFPELEKICEIIKPYMVVIGSQGKTAAERLFFGAHAVYAMQHLTWPLVTVPSGIRFSSVKKIGLACDLDRVVDTIPVDEIKMLTNDFNAELHILNTGQHEVFNPAIVYESGLLGELMLPLKCHYHFIIHENTDEGIIEFAVNNQIDLLIVLPKPHSFLNRLIHKSHTRQLVLHSNVPVMALHL